MNSNTPSPSAAEKRVAVSAEEFELSDEWLDYAERTGECGQYAFAEALARHTITRLAEEAEREARQVNRVDPWFEFADWLRAKAEEM